MAARLLLAFSIIMCLGIGLFPAADRSHSTIPSSYSGDDSADQTSLEHTTTFSFLKGRTPEHGLAFPRPSIHQRWIQPDFKKIIASHWLLRIHCTLFKLQVGHSMDSGYQQALERSGKLPLLFLKIII